MDKEGFKEYGYEKSFDELSFTDDYVFWKVLTTNIELCKELLETIIGVKVSKIEYKHSQEQIEMQTAPNRNLPKRTCHYQAKLQESFHAN